MRSNGGGSGDATNTLCRQLVIIIKHAVAWCLYSLLGRSPAIGAKILCASISASTCTFLSKKPKTRSLLTEKSPKKILATKRVRLVFYNYALNCLSEIAFLRFSKPMIHKKALDKSTFKGSQILLNIKVSQAKKRILFITDRNHRRVKYNKQI